VIHSDNSISFNSLNSDVGSYSSPIFVTTDGAIFIGANYLADLNGSSASGNPIDIPSNPPCILIWNGDVLRDCDIAYAFASWGAVPGFDSSDFNLASDYFFLPFFLEKKYLYQKAAMYYREPRKGLQKWLGFKKT
jgi:hypothetical protein